MGMGVGSTAEAGALIGCSAVRLTGSLNTPPSAAAGMGAGICSVAAMGAATAGAGVSSYSYEYSGMFNCCIVCSTAVLKELKPLRRV
jgi:hypothetical protein